MPTSAERSKSRLLMISADPKVLEKGSDVEERQIGYAREWGEIHIVVFSKTGRTELSPASNLFIYPTNSGTRLFRHLDAARLGRVIIKGRSITEMTCQDPWQTAMAALILKKETGLPLEIQVHADIGSPHFGYSLGNKLRKALALSNLPKADSIRVVSQRIKDYVIGTLGIAETKVSVKPIFVDTDKIRSAPVLPSADLHKKHPQFKKIVLMASRLEKEKNIGLAIRSWPEVLKAVPDAGLIIVGSGSQEKRLRRLASGLGLDGSVVFEPWADKPTLYSYYKTADLFLNTSFFEGYGMAMVEANAAGLPIVSTDVGAARELGATVVSLDQANMAHGIGRSLGV